MRLGGGDRPSPPPLQKRSIWSRAPFGQGLADGGCVIGPVRRCFNKFGLKNGQNRRSTPGSRPVRNWRFDPQIDQLKQTRCLFGHGRLVIPEFPGSVIGEFAVYPGNLSGL
jgi:hypothetical protein